MSAKLRTLLHHQPGLPAPMPRDPSIFTEGHRVYLSAQNPRIQEISNKVFSHIQIWPDLPEMRDVRVRVYSNRILVFSESSDWRREISGEDFNALFTEVNAKQAIKDLGRPHKKRAKRAPAIPCAKPFAEEVSKQKLEGLMESGWSVVESEKVSFKGKETLQITLSKAPSALSKTSAIGKTAFWALTYGVSALFVAIGTALGSAGMATAGFFSLAAAGEPYDVGRHSSDMRIHRGSQELSEKDGWKSLSSAVDILGRNKDFYEYMCTREYNSPESSYLLVVLSPEEPDNEDWVVVN